MTPANIHMVKGPHAPPHADPGVIAAALNSIPANLTRAEWVKLGMAVKSELPDEAGFGIFDEWSATGESYDKSGTRSTWRSIKAKGAVSIGTLFHLAKQHGWNPPSLNEEASKPSDTDQTARIRARQKAAERESSARAGSQREAAAAACRMWSEASEEGTSPYLDRKRVKPYGVRFAADGVLLVPLRDIAGDLRSVQRILPEVPPGKSTDKLLLKGGEKTGLHHWCGSPEGARVLLLAEGYATAASIHEATGIPCAMAVDAGNLVHVAKAIQLRYPQACIFVCADDDRHTEARTGRNPGREGATRAAAILGTELFLPEGLEADETDFNDLHARAGLEVIASILQRAVHGEPLASFTASDTATGILTIDAQPRAHTDKPPVEAKSEKAQSKRSKAQADASGDADEAAADSNGFQVNDAGLWRYVPPGRDGGDGGYRHVCDPLFVDALACDATGGATSLVLRFDTLFGKARTLILPLAELAGDGGAWRGKLADAGFAVPPEVHRRRWLSEYLATRRPSQHARLTERTGWHDSAYVLPAETLGGDPAKPVLFVGERMAEGGCLVRGDAEHWRELIGRHCATQSRLAFAVSVAFAGPLLHWAGGPDSGGFHLVGDSSCGKTTAARVAGSVYGGPGFMQRWRSTDNGIEAIAAAHSDLFLILDELAQLDPKTAGETAYMLGNGAGKVRASRTGGNRPRLSWRLLFLSAGEVGLGDHMAEAGKRSRAGQELRLVDIPADAGRGFGVFDNCSGFDGSGELAQHLVDACGKSFGAVGREWLQHLTRRTGNLSSELREHMATFVAQAVPENASGQVQRVARLFSLVAAGGEIATAHHLTGWEAGQAHAATLQVFSAWIESRPAGIGASEDASILRQVRRWFEANGEARFTDWDRGEDSHRPQTINRAGWRLRIQSPHASGETEAIEWRVLPEVFRSEIAQGWPYLAVLRLLDRKGYIHREKSNGFTSSGKIPGYGRAQTIRIRGTLLEGSDD